MNRLRTATLSLIVFAVVCQVAGAAIVQYDDRAMWLAAAGGVEDFTEDFSGFAVDTPFNPPGTTVVISMGTVGETGMNQAFRNFVETPPFQFTDNNGTNHASCFVNAADLGPGTETDIDIVFDMAMSAWGAGFSGAQGAEMLAIDVLEDGTGIVLGTLNISTNNIDQFLGFVADGGEQIGSVILRAATTIPGGTGRGFGFDDLSAVIAAVDGALPIPTLGTWGLIGLVLLLAAASMAFLRRRQQPAGTA